MEKTRPLAGFYFSPADTKTPYNHEVEADRRNPSHKKSSSDIIHPSSQNLDAQTYAQEKYRQCVRTAPVDPVPKKRVLVLFRAIKRTKETSMPQA